MSGAVLGIDPGASGAVAVLDGAGALLFVEDMPSVEKGVASAELLAGIMAAALDAAGGWLDAAVVEQVGAMSKQGVSSTFKFGTSYGIARMAACSTGAQRILTPTPATWKRDLKLSKDKNASRAMAVKLWPAWADSFRRVMDADRAEAALLAEWGRRNLVGLLVKPERKYLHIPA